MNDFRGHTGVGWLFMLVAFILFLIATLTVGGVISSSLPWAVDGGLAAVALSFLAGW